MAKISKKQEQRDTWTDEDMVEFESALEAQRVIDAELWEGIGPCSHPEADADEPGRKNPAEDSV